MRRLPFLSLALATFALVPIARAQRAQVPPPDTALTDVRLEPGEDAPRHTLILRDGRIAAILDADQELPAGLLRIDGKGALCLPGFVDAWSKQGLEQPEPVIDRDRPLDEKSDVRIDMQLAGRKGLRPAFRAAEALDFDDERIASYLQSGFSWARVAPSGDLLSGSSVLLLVREAAVRDLILAGDAGQMGSFEARGEGYPETLMGAFAQLRQFFWDAEREIVLANRRAEGKSAPRSPHDPDLEAAASLLQGGRLWFEADDSRDLERALRLADELGLELGFLGADEGFEIQARLVERGLPLVLDLDWGKEPEDPRDPKGAKSKRSKKAADAQPDSADEPAESKPEAQAEQEPATEGSSDAAQRPFSYRQPEAERLERRLEWEHHRDNAKALIEAGLPLAFGSGAKEPKQLLEAVRNAVEAGLPRDAALAVLCGERIEPYLTGFEAGAVAVGRPANLCLWSSDPLAEKDAKVSWALVDGHAWQPKAEQASKDDKAGKDTASDKASDKDAEPSKPADATAVALLDPVPPAQDSNAAESEAKNESDEQTGSAGDPQVAEGADPAAEETKETERWLPDHPIETDASRAPELHTGGSFGIQGALLHSAVGPAARGDLWIEGGVLKAVGGELAFPADLQVLDGSNWQVAPGAIDIHSHMAISRGVNEGTFSITADCDMTDVVDAEDIGLYRALAGGTTTIQILHGSANTIGGRSELLKLRGRGQRADDLRFESGPQGIKFALGENPKRSNWGAPGRRFPGTRLGVEATIYRAFERAQEYRAEWQGYEAALARGEDPAPARRDIRLEALQGVLDGRLIVHSHCYRADEILMLLRASTHFGFHVGVLHHALEAFKVAKEIAAYGTGIATFSDWWAYKIEAYDAVPANAALLLEAGAQASIKSDSDELVRHMYHEAAKSVGYAGLDPVAALRLVTLNPAEQLGVQERVGSLEVGKDADLTVFDGDPLSVRSKVLLTFVDGECVFERHDAFGLDQDPPAEPPALASAPGLAASIDPAAPAFAIVGARIHTGAGEVLEGASVLVRGERIAAIGRGLALPAGVQIVDAHGLELYPGLIGLGTSLGLGEIGAVRATDDSSEMGGDQPDLSVASSINADSAHIGVTRFNGMTRAQSVPKSFSAIAGRSAVVRLAGDTWEEMLYRENDMLHVGFPRQDPQAEGDRKQNQAKALASLERRFEAARQYGRIAEERAAAGLPPAPFDPRDAALAPFASGRAKVALVANDAPTLLAAIAFTKRFELDAVLYGAREAWKVLPALQEAQIPVVYGPVLDLPTGEYTPYDAPYATPALLARAGVPFAIYTAEDENPRNLCFHAGFAATFGLSAEEALRAVSLYPARILGVESELGSLTPGKRADLVLVRGDLFEPTSRVVGVWIDGRPGSMDNRQTALTARYQARLEGALGGGPAGH